VLAHRTRDGGAVVAPRGEVGDQRDDDVGRFAEQAQPGQVGRICLAAGLRLVGAQGGFVQPAAMVRKLRQSLRTIRLSSAAMVANTDRGA
jgi:hypothetical protein